MNQKLKVAVACRNASGSADMPVFDLEVTQEQYALGEHYDQAELKAAESGYEGPFVCFDNSEQGAIRAAIAVLGGSLQSGGWANDSAASDSRNPNGAELAELLKEARKIIRASSSRQLAKDWDRRATQALRDESHA